MGLIELSIQYLEQLAQRIPVELFTFIGALTEEIIAPIPSPIVMTLAGSIAESQNKGLLFLVLLAILGALGKIVGSFLMYYFSDKLEDLFINKFGRFIGINSGDVENFGKHFGKGYKDFVIIFLARAIPIVPTAPVSVAAGILKLNLKTYLAGTFLGYLVRNLFYLYIGYLGHESYSNTLSGLDSAESIMQAIFLLSTVVILGYFFYKRSKSGDAFILDKIFGQKDSKESTK